MSVPTTPHTAGEIEVPWQVMLVFGLLVLWALIHTIQTRTIHDFIQYSLYVAAPIAIVASVLLLFGWQKEGFRRPTLEEVFVVPFSACIFVGVGAIYYAIGASMKDAYFWLRSPSLSKSETLIVAPALTLILGLIFFYFRLRLRSFYGLTEAIIGLAVAAQRVAIEDEAAIRNPAFYLAMLTAGVYLVVRGLDNIHQGLSKEPFDPWAKKLFERIKQVSSKANAANKEHSADAANKAHGADAA